MDGYHVEPMYFFAVLLSILTVHKWGETLYNILPLKPIALLLGMLYLPHEFFFTPVGNYGNTKKYLKKFKKKGVL